MRSEKPTCLALRDKVPAGWDVCLLQEVTDFQEGPGILAKDFHESGVPLLRLKNIETPTVRLEGCNFLDPEKVAKKWAHFALHENDLLISTSASLGRVSVVDPASAGSIAYTGIIRFRSSDPARLDRGYLRAFLSSAAFVEQAEQMATGSVIRHFGPSHLKQMAISLPSLPEQRQIADISDALDDRIALLRETNATLESIAQALFKSWFVDFDPVHANAGTRPATLPPELQALFPSTFTETAQGLVPEGWAWQPLSQAYETNPKRVLKKGTSAKYLDMASVGTSGHTTAGVADREFGSGSKFINGDTLLARITPCLENGKTAYVDFLGENEVGWGSTEFIVLKPKSPLPAYHAYLLARFPPFREFAVQSMSGTSGRQRIQNDVLGNYMIAMPDAAIGEAFGLVVEPIQQKIKANHQQSQTLATLRDTLLPRLISGQLRLPDAEAALAKVNA